MEESPEIKGFGLAKHYDKTEQASDSSVRFLMQQASNIIDSYGEESELIDGSVVVTTESTSVYTESGKTFYLRPMRYKDQKKNGRDIYILLDETPDIGEIKILSPSIIRLESGDDGLRAGLYVENAELSGLPEFNNPEHVEIVKNALEDIKKQEMRIHGKKQEQIEREKAQKRRDRQHKRSRMRERIVDSVIEYGPVVGATLFVGGMCGGLIYAVTQIDYVTDSQKVDIFDDAGLVIEDQGTVICIGESGNPAHSFELLQNTSLGIDEVPELGQYRTYGSKSYSNDVSDYGPNVEGGDPVYDETEANPELVPITSLREFVINSSNDEEQMEWSGVALANPDDCIVAWTDEGSLQASELEVRLREDRVEVEWMGQETSDEDDPRVLIMRQDAYQELVANS